MTGMPRRKRALCAEDWVVCVNEYHGPTRALMGKYARDGASARIVAHAVAMEINNRSVRSTIKHFDHHYRVERWGYVETTTATAYVWWVPYETALLFEHGFIKLAPPLGV